MGLLYSGGHACDWKVVDADMRLKEPRKCDLVLSDHLEEMPWFARPQSRYLFSTLGIFQGLIILYLQEAGLSQGSVTRTLMVRIAIKGGDMETRRVDGEVYGTSQASSIGPWILVAANHFGPTVFTRLPINRMYLIIIRDPSKVKVSIMCSDTFSFSSCHICFSWCDPGRRDQYIISFLRPPAASINNSLFLY